MTAPVLDVMHPETAASIAPDLETDARQLTILASSSTAIETVEGLGIAVGDRQRIADLRKRVVDYFAPIKTMAYQLHRQICQRESAILDPLDGRDRSIRDAMSAFKRAQDEQRLALERAEQDRRKREAEATVLHEAASLESAGLPEIAAALVEDAMVAPPPVVTLPDRTREVAGFKTRRVWKWKYQGTAADREQVLALIPRQFLAVDEIKINSYVRAMKSSGSIPGIEIYSVDEPVR
jgi:hypothetical protein